ncbi:IclR family transcriptional regulator [Pseudonocardia sulfidoxydans NBRC 16205]|uniref:IclR family transcriptional regulator n=1 Tax=Pseudonocardia sulfidoxydans NBRC 16205 TaxID=1223511 RepID=A0A511DC74_9PSEU|nr:IclR family transcriptional regulator [Pseudonocardia sulfidoxydans]GEL22003.1 IclR family transcriptional regulator [Pseudonocardia sulfidoxydans NBRC 16205]
MASDVPAVVNAVRLLERIAREWPDPVSTGTLIDELGLNRSTCYNILGTLQRAGWAATRGDRGGWWLGPRLLAVAGSAPDWVGDIVRQELEDLSRRLGFLVFALRRHGPSDYAVVAKADRGHGVRMTVGVGDTFPFSAPAIMRAFHAWSAPDEVDRLIDKHGLTAFTDETTVDRTALRAELAATRERGYGQSLREYEPGQSGVSAPVFDTNGQVSMALCSLAFASELNERTVGNAGELVRACGVRITERTGGTFPTR